MGYAYYKTPRGMAGYGVEDVCHEEGCEEKCDRGLGCLCGDEPGYDDEFGCGWWFCGHHMYGPAPEQCHGGQCKACQEAWDRDHPDEEAADLAGYIGR